MLNCQLQDGGVEAFDMGGQGLKAHAAFLEHIIAGMAAVCPCRCLPDRHLHVDGHSSSGIGSKLRVQVG